MNKKEELENIIKLIFPVGMKLSTLDGDSRDVETRLRDLFEKVNKEAQIAGAKKYREAINRGLEVGYTMADIKLIREIEDIKT